MATDKLKLPLENNDEYVYPITTASQVILADGSRWNGKFGSVKSVCGINPDNKKNVAITASDCNCVRYATDAEAEKGEGVAQYKVIIPKTIAHNYSSNIPLENIVDDCDMFIGTLGRVCVMSSEIETTQRELFNGSMREYKLIYLRGDLPMNGSLILPDGQEVQYGSTVEVRISVPSNSVNNAKIDYVRGLNYNDSDDINGFAFGPIYGVKFV